MEKEMEWNAAVTKLQHTHYVRNSRAITVAWFVFCACYTILNAVVFIQPFWIGDTNESPGVGYFGLYEWCERAIRAEYTCTGDFLDFTTIQNNIFQACSFLVGGAALLFIISIVCMLLFLFLKAATVLKMCGWMQLLAAVFMAVACIIYPIAWDDPVVQRICGGEASAYNMDKCQVRWGYILAIVLIFDAFILAILAFVLAARQAKMIPEFKKLKEANMSYIHEWRDDQDSFTNHGYAGTFNEDRPPMAKPHQSVHQRHTFAPLESSNNRPYQLNEPLVIPVDDLGDFDLRKSYRSDASGDQPGPDSPRFSSEQEVSPRSNDSNKAQSSRSAASSEAGSLEEFLGSGRSDEEESIKSSTKGDSPRASSPGDDPRASLKSDEVPL